MKVKTSITLSVDLLKAVDKLAGQRSRSAFIEDVLRAYLGQQSRSSRDARELRLLNQAADRLNAEASDVLGFQAPWPGE
jgi:metal-responsive CopG/Arc/MetJ family transcriptional regulator